MMVRFYLRLILITVVILSAVLLVIHAQPYDDHELRELLLPEACPAPCFMGIRPGLTTMDEAVKILEESEWGKLLSGGQSSAQWYWNGRQPQYIDTKLPAFIASALPSEVSHPTITQFTFVTQFKMGKIFILMHKPVAFSVTAAIPLPEDKGRQINVSVRYSDLFALARIACPATLNELIYQNVQITLYDPKAVQLYPEEQSWDFNAFKLALKDLLRCNI